MPVHPVAPVLDGPVLSAQRWENLSLLHWPIEPDAIADRLPAGVRPDVVDGRTYVGLVPFHMRGAGPSRLATPYFGTFAETNVRVYTVDDADNHGIFFLTLDASRLATVLLARLSLRLPYAWSAMSIRRGGDEVTYRSLRRWPDRGRAAASTVRLRIGPPTEPTPLEVWLTARWGLHTTIAGRTLWVPNQHGPWPLYSAELLDLDADLVDSCGLAVDRSQMLRPLWSPGVRTTFARPRLVGHERRGG